ncbi:hypothetical protein DIPPA_19487 [Diplonema papillatum]|nr:hypothetical protein DIPPA_19487 [Diplonema papillatum]
MRKPGDVAVRRLLRGSIANFEQPRSQAMSWEVYSGPAQNCALRVQLDQHAPAQHKIVHFACNSTSTQTAIEQNIVGPRYDCSFLDHRINRYNINGAN